MTGLQHVFGPVPSRRLGRSLGVDVIPRKLCTLDCIFCEIGRTDKRALRRKEYVAPSKVLPEIRTAVQAGGIDTITFSGSGEPTLNSSLGFMIHDVKSWTTLPVAVITNGTLLFMQDVRRDLLEADIVLPSLNAATPDAFERTNRPHPQLKLDMILEGLKQFRTEYRGRFWLEVVLVSGFNDSKAELAALKSAIARIRPDRIQLNTVVRPPSEQYARRLSMDRLEEIREYFGDMCEVIPDCVGPQDNARDHVEQQDIVAMISRRPMTAADIAVSVRMSLAAIRRQLALLEQDQIVQSNFYGGEWYYRSAERKSVARPRSVQRSTGGMT
ncbi:MAG: radical SAM protein [Bacteroidota bacterium]